MQNQQKNQKLEYEKKKEQWEEACPKNCIAGAIYSWWCGLGLCMWWKCGKEHKKLRTMAHELRMSGESIEDVRCCPVCCYGVFSCADKRLSSVPGAQRIYVASVESRVKS